MPDPVGDRARGRTGGQEHRRRDGRDRDVSRGSLRPALVQLHRDQAAALAAFRAGFETRRDLLDWMHGFQYLSLGRVTDGFYWSVATRPMLQVVMLTGRRREELRPDVDPDVAESERRRLAARYLRPACGTAFRDLRKRATEYIDEDRPDAGSLGAIAGRPALDEHRERQERSLEQWLDGFDDLEAAEEWLHDLDLATFGAIHEIEPEFDHGLLAGPVERRTLLEDADRYERERERLAARFLLPACNRCVRELIASAGESPETEPERQEAAKL